MLGNTSPSVAFPYGKQSTQILISVTALNIPPLSIKLKFEVRVALQQNKNNVVEHSLNRCTITILVSRCDNLEVIA